jgi:hypothetical protein
VSSFTCHVWSVCVFWFQDLVKLCVEYMCEHIAYAAANNQLISWLQYTLTCGHYQAAQVLLLVIPVCDPILTITGRFSTK